MRKTKIVTVPTGADGKPNRDTGKAFLLTEMSAVRSDKWATRALLAMAASGIDIPEEVLRMGLGAVMAAGFRALLTVSFVDAEPLLDEMMECVSVVPDPRRPDIMRPMIDEDIDEVTTLWLLRSEVVEIHTGFSVAAFLSKLGKAATTQTPDSSDIETFPRSSEPS